MATVSVREHRFDVAAVVFDKDGTLLDLDASWSPIAVAWVGGIAPEGGAIADLLCDALGLDRERERLRPDSPFAMGTLADIASDTRLLLDAEGWPLDRIDAAIERASVAAHAIAPGAHMDCLADVPALFHRLRGAGLRIAVFTSDEPAPTTLFLDRFGLHDLVDMVITAADVAMPKPAPDGLHVIAAALDIATDRLLMVGDSIADRDAALAAGSHFVAIGHTSHAAAGAHAAIDSVADLSVRVSGGWRPGGVRRG